MDAETAALIAEMLREEEVAAQDRRVAEMLSRGEELPPLTPEQRRMHERAPLVKLDSPEPEAVVFQDEQRVEEDQFEIIETPSSPNLSPAILQPDTAHEMEADTPAVNAQLVFEDLGHVLAGPTAKSSMDDDHLDTSSWAAALITDAAHLEAPITSEEAAVYDNPPEIIEPQSSSNLSPIVLQLDTASEKDAETVALNTPLAFKDLGQVLAGPTAKSSTDDDQQYASSWAAALITDAAYLEALITAEEAAVHDRLAAEMLSRGEELPPLTPAQSRLLDPAFNMHPELAVTAAENSPAVQQLETKSSGKKAVRSASPADDTQALYTTADWGALEEYTDWNENASILANIEKSKSEFDYLSLGAGPSVNRNKWVQCTICYDALKYSDALQTPCDHNYCTNCIVALVEKFTRDETYFPLRCCQQPIPPTSVDAFLSPALRVTFAQKHAEFSVPAADRLYCAQPACAAFLGSASAAGVALGATGTLACPTCGHAVCVRCREPAHGDEDCAAHAGTAQLRALAQTERWQTCVGCGSVVERVEGCYHMTCRCGTQFCYQCAARWKTCAC